MRLPTGTEPRVPSGPAHYHVCAWCHHLLRACELPAQGPAHRAECIVGPDGDVLDELCPECELDLALDERRSA